MNKKVILLIILLAALPVIAGLFFLYPRKRPPIETKFVQNTEVPDSKVNIPEEPDNSAIVKKVTPLIPGDKALVSIPNHTYQTFNNCGPATLSMILSFYGKTVPQNELGNLMRPYQVASGDNDDKTIFTYEFENWAEKYGVEAVSRINGDINLLKKFTANGIPVVVKTWLHKNEDIGHFRIVRGFDEEKQSIIQDDSYEGPNRKVAYFDFLSMWQPFNYAYIIVYKPEQKDVVEAIMGSETDEKTAWENSLKRAVKEAELDTANVYPLFNQSAAQYHLGNYKESTAVFERIEEKLPRRMLWYQIEPILAYYELGNYDRVFEITGKILGNGNRAYSEVYILRGNIYKNRGEIDKAKQEYEKAVLYNKNSEEAKKALESV